MGPDELGIWQVFVLLQSICDILRIGVVNGLNREYPLLLSLNQTTRANTLANTAATFNQLSGLTGLAIHTLLLPFFLTKGIDYAVACTFSAISWYCVTRTSLYHGLCRSSTNFKQLSTIQLTEAILLFLTLPLVSQFGLLGYCIRLATLNSIVLALSMRVTNASFIWQLDIESLVLLARTGMPLYATALLWTAGNSAERAMLIYQNDLPAAGTYAAAFSIMSAASLPNSAITQYLYPKLTRHFGKGDKIHTTLSTAIQLTALNFIMTAIVCLLAYITAKPFIQIFAPEFQAAVPLVELLLLSGILLSFRSLTTVFPVYAYWKYHFAWVAIFVLVKWALCYSANPTQPHYLSQLAFSNSLAAIASATAAMGILWRISSGHDRSNTKSTPEPASVEANLRR